jgi:hypothetical protein
MLSFHLLIDIYTKTFAMFLARMVFFRLHESPRYLVHAGRPQDALESLQMISRFNGSELDLDLKDVEDRINDPPTHAQDLAVRTETGVSPSSRFFDADDDAEMSSSPTDIKPSSTTAHVGTPLSSTPLDGSEGAVPAKDYSATGGSEAPLAAYAASERRSHPYHHSLSGRDSFHDDPLSSKEEEISVDDIDVPPARPRLTRNRRSRGDTFSSVRSSLYEAADRAYWVLPPWIRRPVRAWLGRFKMVLVPEWRRTTLLVWATWWGIALAFTMFNVYLPKMLETRRVVSLAETSSLERTLWDVVIFTVAGCPGSLVRFAPLGACPSANAVVVDELVISWAHG